MDKLDDQISRRSMLQGGVVGFVGFFTSETLFGQSPDVIKINEAEKSPRTSRSAELSVRDRNNRDAYATVATKNIHDIGAYEVPMLLASATLMMEMNPNLSSDEIVESLNYAERELGKARGAAIAAGEPFGVDAAAETLIDIAKNSGIPVLAVTGIAIDRAMKDLDYSSDSLDYSERKTKFQNEAQDQYEEHHGFNSEELWRSIWEEARFNPAFAEVVEKFGRDLSKVSVGDTTEQIFARNPFLKTHQDLDTLLKFAQEVHRKGSSSPADLKQYQKWQNKLQLRTKKDELTKENMKQFRQAAKLSHGVLSNTLGIISQLGDKQTQQDAKQIRTFLDGQLKLGLKFSEIPDVDSVLGGVKLGTDLLGTALGLMGSLMGGPSTEQMILEQLVELREQVQKMHEDLADRIDGVREQLEEHHIAVMNQFNSVTGTLERLGDDVAAMKEAMMGLKADVLELGKELNLAREEILDTVVAVYESELKERRSSYLEHKEVSGELSREKWIEGLKFFCDNAAEKSREAVFIYGSEQNEVGVDNQSAAKELSNRTRKDDHDYISRVLAERFGFQDFSVPNGLFPNVDMWLKESALYLKFLEQREDGYIENFSHQHLTEMRRLGEEILSAKRSIKVTKDKDDKIVPNDPLVNVLLTNYEREVENILGTIAQSGVNFRAKSLGQRIGLDGEIRHIDDDPEKPLQHPIDLIPHGIPGKNGTSYATRLLKIPDPKDWPFSDAVTKYIALNPECKPRFEYSCEWVNKNTQAPITKRVYHCEKPGTRRHPMSGQMYDTRAFAHICCFDEIITTGDLKVTLSVFLEEGTEREYSESASLICVKNKIINRTVNQHVRDFQAGDHFFGLSHPVDGDPNTPIEDRIRGDNPKALIHTWREKIDPNQAFELEINQENTGDNRTPFETQIGEAEGAIRTVGVEKEYEQNEIYKHFVASVQHEVDRRIAEYESTLETIVTNSSEQRSMLMPASEQRAIETASEKMNGARKLLQRTIAIGMHETLQDDLALLGSLEGFGSIPDSAMLCDISTGIADGKEGLASCLLKDSGPFLREASKAREEWERFVCESYYSEGFTSESFPRIERRIAELRLIEETIKSGSLDWKPLGKNDPSAERVGDQHDSSLLSRVTLPIMSVGLIGAAAYRLRRRREELEHPES